MKPKHRKPGTAGEVFKKEGTESWELFIKALANVSEWSAQKAANYFPIDSYKAAVLNGSCCIRAFLIPSLRWPNNFLWKNCLMVSEKHPTQERLLALGQDEALSTGTYVSLVSVSQNRPLQIIERYYSRYYA